MYRVLELDVRIEPEIAAETEVVLNRVERALGLIRRTDQWQFEAMRTRFNCILVKRGPGAQFWPETSVCVLEPNNVLTRSVAITALSIIHELAHARIAERVPIHAHVRDPRLERVCIRSQIRFARRLSSAGWNMEDVIRHYEAAITVRMNPSPRRE